MKDNVSSLLKNKNMAYLASETSHASEKKVKRIAFLLLENFSLMAFTGAVDALITTNLMKSKTVYEVLVVGSEEGVTVSDVGIEVKNDISLAALDIYHMPLDVLIVCGGLRVRPKTTALLRNKLKSADSHGVVLGGLWNGAYFLAEAGLLNGYQCAYHPDGRAMMLE